MMSRHEKEITWCLSLLFNYPVRLLCLIYPALWSCSSSSVPVPVFNSWFMCHSFPRRGVVLELYCDVHLVFFCRSHVHNRRWRCFRFQLPLSYSYTTVLLALYRRFVVTSRGPILHCGRQFNLPEVIAIPRIPFPYPHRYLECRTGAEHPPSSLPFPFSQR